MSCGHGGHDHGGPTKGRPESEGGAGVEYSLYSKIVMDDVECLNEAEENSGRAVFKSWEDRLDKEKVRSRKPSILLRVSVLERVWQYAMCSKCVT